MFKNYVMLFALGHILGDFYFQSGTMAKKKDESLEWLFLHGAVYGGAQLLVILPILSRMLLLAAMAVTLGHFVIDTAKYYYIKWKNRTKSLSLRVSRNLFFFDQFLHGIFLIAVSYGLSACAEIPHINSLVNNFFRICDIRKSDVLSWTLAILLVHKPVNIAIQKMLAVFRPQKTKSAIAAVNNAGRFIGTVERSVMLILLAAGQYSAIGLVLTAKSIARYDKISKDSDFAEYYLLGTLLSLLFVIAVSTAMP